jgi:hypothetical protein
LELKYLGDHIDENEEKPIFIKERHILLSGTEYVLTTLPCQPSGNTELQPDGQNFPVAIASLKHRATERENGSGAHLLKETCLQILRQRAFQRDYFSQESDVRGGAANGKKGLYIQENREEFD